MLILDSRKGITYLVYSNFFQSFPNSQPFARLLKILFVCLFVFIKLRTYNFKYSPSTFANKLPNSSNNRKKTGKGNTFFIVYSFKLPNATTTNTWRAFGLIIQINFCFLFALKYYGRQREWKKECRGTWSTPTRKKRVCVVSTQCDDDDDEIFIHLMGYCLQGILTCAGALLRK